MGQAFSSDTRRKAAATTGEIMIIGITMLSIASSAAIYYKSLHYLPSPIREIFTGICVLVLEGCFGYLLISLRKVFTHGAERTTASAMLAFIGLVMIVNIITHVMDMNGAALLQPQQIWVQWAAIVAVIAVFVGLLLLRHFDPAAQLARQGLAILGVEEAAILEARRMALQSEPVQKAIQTRSAMEAAKLVHDLIGPSEYEKLFGDQQPKKLPITMAPGTATSQHQEQQPKK